MKINNTDLRKMIRGAYWFEEIEEYLAFYRCSKEQIDALRFDSFYYNRTKFSASIHIDFETDAREISFAYKIVEIRGRDTFDLFVNDELSEIKEEKDMAEEGILTFSLPQGTKNVKIYFPIDAEIRMKDFCIDGNYRITEDKRVNALWIGDSITQGAGSFIGSQTYVNIVSRKMRYNSLNQGIAGWYHHTGILTPLADFIPDIVFVSLGTNDNPDKDLTTRRIEAFYEELQKLYYDKPIFVITPLWRGDSEALTQKIFQVGGIMKSVCKRYDNIRVIDGLSLVPHVSQCFCGDDLHPNAWGMEVYANNLISYFRKNNVVFDAIQKTL